MNSIIRMDEDVHREGMSSGFLIYTTEIALNSQQEKLGSQAGKSNTWRLPHQKPRIKRRF